MEFKKKSRIEKQEEAVQPIRFLEEEEELKYQPIKFMDQDVNSRFQYAILKTTENGRYVRGNMLYYSLNGVEIYTDINNIIFVDEQNKTFFVRNYESALSEIAPDNPEKKQYIVLYTDLEFDEFGNEIPLRWESYIGRMNAYEAIKTNISLIDPDKSLVLVENVALKDSLSIRQFVEYLVNADIVPDEIDFDEYL
jgi:hypothetical protein